MGAFMKEIQAKDLEERGVLIRWLKAELPNRSGNAVKSLIQSGKVFINGRAATKATTPLKVGQVIEIRENAPRQDRVKGPEIRVLHCDAHVVVAEKPPGIITLPYQDERVSLAESLRRIIPKIEGKKGQIPPLFGVHRLDKLASGLVVLARDQSTQMALKDQFAEHSVERAYRAVVQGEVRFKSRVAESHLLPDRGDGLKGSARSPEQGGKYACTHLLTVASRGKTSLLECRLETGRTHQIRIHLAEMGHPLVGEPVYIRNHRGPWVKGPRMMLHAVELGFIHPMTQKALHFKADMPHLMKQFLKKQGYRLGAKR